LIPAWHLDHVAGLCDRQVSTKTVVRAEAIAHVAGRRPVRLRLHVLIDDLITAGSVAVPSRPGPVPGCSDAELLTIATTRDVLGRRSEAGFLAEVARDWAHLFRGCRTRARPTAASAGYGAR
jgi:hypothetical protein